MEKGEKLKREREGKKKVRIKEEREEGRQSSCAQGSDCNSSSSSNGLARFGLRL